MSEIKEIIKKDHSQEEEKAATLVEYALLVALIAVVCIVSVRIIGQKTSQKFSMLASSL